MAEGYDCNFVSSPPDELTCLVCLLVAREPNQVGCCGKVFCSKCLQQMKRKTHGQWKCPNCGKKGPRSFPDVRGKRNIEALCVKCESVSCQWEGELGSLKQHLQECSCVLVPCPNNCELEVKRQDLQEHVTNLCPNRQHTCPKCKQEGMYQFILNEHDNVCPQFEVECPNFCGEKIPRKDLYKHFVHHCPEETVPCKYAQIGCAKDIHRKDLQKHESDDLAHLHLLLAVALNPSCPHTPPAPTPLQCVFEMPQFENYKAMGKSFYGPGFYSHQGGYKMCIAIDPNGWGEAEGTHVSVWVFLMQSANDDKLVWPFRGTVTIELLNQKENSKHYLQTLEFSDDKDDPMNARVTDRKCSTEGFGLIFYISHTDIHGANYLEDGSLHFRASVSVSARNKPWLTSTHLALETPPLPERLST